MRTTLIRGGAAVLAGFASILLPAAAGAADSPSPSPSSSAGPVTVTKAGTSFLTAAALGPGQQAKLAASTGDYLYWSFTATEGQNHDVAITVTLPAAASRHGGSTWTVDVFDGLRRRQACTAGAQSPHAAAADTTVVLGCTLRQIRSWAEPWSGDPLPGTYYVRLSVVELPEEDLGLPVQIDMSVAVTDDGDPQPEGGSLQAPLVPAANRGAVLPGGSDLAVDPSAEPEPAQGNGWFTDLPARWIWTVVGGILAAVAGIVGFTLTYRPRRTAS